MRASTFAFAICILGKRRVFEPLQNANAKPICELTGGFLSPVRLGLMAQVLLCVSQHVSSAMIGFGVVIKFLITAAAAFSLSGCALLTAEKWPEPGAGGLAEFTAVHDERVADLAARVDAARSSGARTFAAADLEIAEILLARVKREFAGGLYVDGEVNLVQLQTLVAAIERRAGSSIRKSGMVR